MRRLVAIGVVVAAVLGVLAASGQAADSCSIYWTGATSSDWSTASNWSLTDGGSSAGRLPGASDLVCMSTTPTTSMVTLSSGSVEVGGIEWGGTAPVRPQLTVAGTLQVDTLADATGTSAIYNLIDTGTVVANGSISTTSLTLQGELDGPGKVTVGSSGTLALGGGSAAPKLSAGADLVSSATGTQASPNGTLDMSGASTLENSGSLTLADGQGISDTDSAHPSQFVNDASGTVTSGTGTSGVSIAAAVTNDGTINVPTGSQLSAGATGLSSSDAGTLDVAGTLTLNGDWSLTTGASTSPSSSGSLTITGTVTAAGSNTLKRLHLTGTLIALGAVAAPGFWLDGTLEGPGKLTATGTVSLSGTLRNGAHLLNSGTAHVGGAALYGASELENSGTMTVDGEENGIVDQDPAHPSQVVNDSTGTITRDTGCDPSQCMPSMIEAAVHNAGTISVPQQGRGAHPTLIIGGTANTDTGTLHVEFQARLVLDGSWSLGRAIGISNTSGGTLSVATLTAPGDNALAGIAITTLIAKGTPSLSRGTSVANLEGPGTATIPSGQSASVTGFSEGANLVNDGTASVGGSLSGGSTVENAGSMTVGSLADTDSTDPSQVINDASATLTYAGTGSGASAAVTNHGTISVPSGTGKFGAAGFSSTDDGVLTAAADGRLVLGGSWALANGASTGPSSAGPVQVAGTTTAAGSNTLAGLDVTGTLVAEGAVTAPSLVLEGELDGPGTTTVSSGSTLRLGGSALAVMKAGAKLVNDGTGTQDPSEGTLDMYGASRFENAGSLALADGQGVYDLDSGHPSQVVNDASGTVSFAGSSGSATVSVAPAFTNNGLVNVTGGTLSVPGLTNLSSGKLTGGSYRVAGGTLAFASGIGSNAATLRLASTGSFSADGGNALTGLTTNTGTLTLEQSLALTGALSNTGTVNVGQGTLSVSSYSQTAGATALEGGLKAGSGSGPVVIAGGVLSGTGAVAGDLSGAGTIQPAGPVQGPLVVTGTYDGSSGTLSIPVSGTSNPGTDYGQLSVDGTAKLGGRLSIVTKSGYLPPTGTTYTILKAAGVSGKFSTVDGASLSDRHYVVSYTSTSVVLTVQSSVPTVAAVSPRAGATAGGNTVKITGTNFESGATVSFGTVAATSVKIVSSTEITATAPAHPAGTVNVTVQTAAGKSATGTADYYAYGAPAITGINPNGGPVAGGTTVTITGRGFAPGMTVTVGGSAATAVTVVSASQVTARVPAHAAATVNVSVHTPAGTSATGSQALYAYGAPTVTSVSPDSGPRAGGTTVTIIGSGFVPGAEVGFGSSASPQVTFVSGTELRANTPARPGGTVNVTVRTPGGTSPISAADHYTYTS